MHPANGTVDEHKSTATLGVSAAALPVTNPATN